MKHKKIILIIYCILFVSLSIYFFNYSYENPYLGINVRTDNSNWKVVEVDPIGLGYKAGIQTGDQLVNIDGKAPGSHYVLKKWFIVEGVSDITVKKADNQMAEYSFITYKESMSRIIPIFFLSFTFVSLGIFTVFHKQQSKVVKRFFYLMLVSSITLLSAIPSSRGMIGARVLEFISISFIPYLLIRFFEIFPSKISSPIIVKLRKLSGSMTFFIILGQLIYIISNFSVILWNGLITFNIIHFIFSILLSVFLILNHLKSKSPATQNQIRLLILGVLFSFLPFLVLSIIPQIWLNRSGIPFEFTVISAVFFPMVVTYVLVKRRIIDVHFIFHRIIFYSAISILLLIFVNVVLLLFPVISVKLATLDVIVVNVIVILTLCFLEVVRFLFKNWLNRDLFNKRKMIKEYKLKILKQDAGDQYFIQSAKLLGELINKVLNVSGVCLVQYRNDFPFILYSSGRFKDELFQLDDFIHLEKETKTGDQDKNIILPLYIQNEKKGLLIIGHKRNMTHFNREELKLINELRDETLAIFKSGLLLEGIIKNYHHEKQIAKKLQQKFEISNYVNRMIMEEREEEKRKLSNWLHDEILQYIILLANHLQEGSFSHNQKSSRIQILVQNLQELILKIRDMCTDLYPIILDDLGLKASIEWLIRDIKNKSTLNVHFEWHMIKESDLPQSVKLTIFRSIKELLTNVIKHANATDVKIILMQKSDQLICHVIDNGSGFKIPENIYEFAMYNHMGLVTIIKQVEDLNGMIIFRSNQREGTKALLEIPLNGLLKRVNYEQAN